MLSDLFAYEYVMNKKEDYPNIIFAHVIMKQDVEMVSNKSRVTVTKGMKFVTAIFNFNRNCLIFVDKDGSLYLLTLSITWN